MTKKDYIKIANTIRGVVDYYRGHAKSGTSPQPIDSVLITEFSHVLQSDNPRFDREKFENFIKG